MKKKYWQKIILVSFYSFLFFLAAAQTQAANLYDAFRPSTLAPVAGSYDTETDLNQIVATVIQSFLGLLGVIFIVLIIYGGIIWMTAEGDEARVEKAQKNIQNASIGLIIIISAYAVSYFILNALSQKVLAP